MAKIAISFQNGEWLRASTMRPKARSLSATEAAGVGDPSLVPLVWSLGRQMITSCGNSPALRELLRAPARMKSARYWSGTAISQPTYAVGEKGPIVSIIGSLSKTTSWLSPFHVR